MATTLELATDEILGRFKSQWDADSPAIIGGSPLAPGKIEYEFLDYTGRPEKDQRKPWCRITIRHSEGVQATLRGEGELFRNTGTVIVQVFAFAQDSTAATMATRLAQVAKKAFEGKRTENVWFRRCRYAEEGRQGTWYQINVSADFEWDERR